jgi:hypothetical protein
MNSKGAIGSEHTPGEGLSQSLSAAHVTMLRGFSLIELGAATRGRRRH